VGKTSLDFFGVLRSAADLFIRTALGEHRVRAMREGDAPERRREGIVVQVA